MTTFTGIYRNYLNIGHQASILLTSQTINIHYVDEEGKQKYIYWLADNILSFDEHSPHFTLIYRNIDGSFEKLIVRDHLFFDAIKKNFRSYKFIGGLHYSLVGNTRNKIIILMAFFLALILVIYLWIIPWIAVRIADNFSREYEISLGSSMYQSIMGAYSEDTTKSRLLNTFYKQLHFEVNYPVRVTVVESDETNAFAIPGGRIIIFDAILDEMKTPEELAALLAHEVSHIQLRHSLKNLARTLGRKMFLSIVIGSESRIAGFFVDNADNLKGLEYSRSLETEADNNGLRLMAKSGIDQRGMLRLMELLQKESVGKGTPFLNTHPVFEKRIENIKNQIRDSANNSPDEELRTLFHEIYE